MRNLTAAAGFLVLMIGIIRVFWPIILVIWLAVWLLKNSAR